MDIGRIIVDRLYAGDIEAWRRSRSRKVSFRRLTARAARDLRFSGPQLYRAVALYELSRRLDLKRSALSTTHLRAVVGLPEPSQMALLAAAERERWSTGRTAREASLIRAGAAQRRGRRPLNPVVKAVRAVLRSWHAVETAIENTDLRELAREDLDDLNQVLDEVGARLAKLGDQLSPQQPPHSDPSRPKIKNG